MLWVVVYAIMAIGLNDIDASVAASFAECLQTVYFRGGVRPLETHQPLRAALFRARWLGAGWTTFAPIVAGYASVMIGTQVSNTQPALAWGLFGASFLFSGASLWHTYHRDLLARFRTDLSPEVLRAALPLMTLPPMESTYAETMALLATSQGVIEAQTAQSILLGLNELLAAYRPLEAQHQQLVEAIAHHPVTALESDLARLQQQLQATADPATQQALQQSLQLCTARLEDARMMEQNRQRVAAQLEAIQQGFASVQSSLLRLQTTPTLNAPAAMEIQHVVTEVQQRVQAVEAAVQEVAQLSTGR